MTDSQNNAMNVDKTSFAFGFVAGVALIAVVMLSTGGFGGGTGKVAGDFKENTYGQPSAGQPAGQPTQPIAAAVPPIQAGEPLRGNPEATIDVIEYSDFECPFCVRHLDSINRLLTEYGDRVRLAYRHFPLSFHPEAQKAAEASECAEEQGKFWEMHDKIFEANTAQNMGVGTWKQAAADLGLNTGQFDDCLDTGKYAQAVQDQLAEGQKSGVEGTPATFINGQLVSGAVPYEQLKAVIDQALQQ